MFNIFRKKIKPNYYHPELKPSLRIEKLLIEFILPEIEQYGFKYLKSEMSFKRNCGEFVNEISFQKNKWNGGNEVCAFKPILSIYSVELPKYLKTSKDNNRSGFLGGSVEYIDGWSTKYFDGYYDLAKEDNFKVIEILNENLLKIGIPYFESFKTYKELVDHYIKNEKRYYMTPSLFNLCEMHNDKEKAESILNWFLDFQENSKKEFHQDTLDRIENCKIKLKNWL
ncbi:hypothetical protein [Flavobacterium macrobrachii]|jgi:hypothetical protein|uniref:hypothetical protein n=1 Tax=Flavobacterium macrobrachii TaxID=591204 RepID=UPI0037C12B7D